MRRSFYWLIPTTLIIYSLIFGVFKVRLPWINPPVFFFIASLILFSIFKEARTNLLKKSWRSEIALGLALAFIPIVGMAVLEFLLPHQQPATHIGYSLNQWLTLLVFAPLGEELYFRGLLQKYLEPQAPIFVAIALQAILFMACHALWALGPLCLGLINGYLVYKRKDIRACIVLHLIANLYGPLMLAYWPNTFERLRMFYY